MAKRRTFQEAAALFRGEPDQCWYLPKGIGSLKPNGYYRIGISGVAWAAHRLSYTVFKGPIPAGTDIDHQCHNRDPYCSLGNACLHRRCVNPAHLEAVPRGVNSLRGKSQMAIRSRLDRCAQGHEFNEENTYIHVRPGTDSTRRQCRTCRREQARTLRKRRAAS